MTTRRSSSRRGVWIFPASYPIHIAEEYAVAGGFVAWAGRELGAALPIAEFIAWNVVAFGLLCLGAWLAARDARYRWIEIAVAVAFAGNALAHLLASVITWSYSPGLVTGVLLWVPLGVARGVPAFRASGVRGRRAGVLVGLAAIVAPLAVLGAEFRRAATSGEPHWGRRVGWRGTIGAGGCTWENHEGRFAAGTELTKVFELVRGRR